MALFDEFERTDPVAPRHRRKEFDFLNRSSLAICGNMRSVYENAFAHFSGNKLDVRARFRSPINFQHNGAAFELLIHELLGARGLNPKPGVLPDGTTPDFMVDLPQGGSAIIEATMLKDGENIYSSEILDFISEIDCPGIELERSGSAASRTRRCPRKPLWPQSSCTWLQLTWLNSRDPTGRVEGSVLSTLCRAARW